MVNDVPGSERGIGFVFQNYALFRYMTVYDNIAFGKAEIDARVRELLKLIDCEGLEKRYPSQLSGGQRQRVAFARALAPNPQLLLLDEPFAAIDAKVRLELRTWLREMINRLGITSIFVTHPLCGPIHWPLGPDRQLHQLPLFPADGGAQHRHSAA